MKSPIQLRLTGFLATVLLGALVIGWTERHAWRQTDALQKRFRALQDGDQHLAERVEVMLLRLEILLIRGTGRGEPADRVRFQEQCQTFQDWVAARTQGAESPAVRARLEEIQAAFAEYRTTAEAMLVDAPPTTSGTSPREWLEATERHSERLLTLGAQLADAQRRTLRGALAESEGALAELKMLLVVSLILLVALSAIVTILVYRGMIAPLRFKLIETRALAERQEKLAALGALAAGVAHEIRNPLTAIKARLFTQRKLLPDDSGPLEDNRFISDEIGRLDSIIKDFLLFARPSEPRFERIKATAPLRELTELIGPDLEKRAITLRHEFLADPEIRADRQQLKQVLINLIQNAADSVGQDGSITLRTRTRPARAGAHAPHVALLEVEDTGKGVPPEIQKRLFDPFFTTKETGTGLGLSIAARIVEKHGGRLGYETHAGRGAVFHVILPIAQSHDGEIR